MPKKTNPVAKPVVAGQKSTPPAPRAAVPAESTMTPASEKVPAKRTVRRKVAPAPEITALTQPSPASVAPALKAAVKRVTRRSPALSEIPRTTKASTRATVKSLEAPILPAYTHEDIALRAYFIAQKRHAQGLQGDPHQDWIEAERQLSVEVAAKGRRKR